MSISNAVANANSGLAAAQRRAGLVSNNIANALTPGFARREISVSEQIVNGGGSGVKIVGVNRVTDPVLTAERRTADGLTGFDQALASAYTRFEAALGGTDDPFSLFNKYQNLETTLRDLSQSPESATLQKQTLIVAKDLAGALNNLSDLVQGTRQDADAQIAKEVAFVNTALKQVDALNAQISKASVNGRDATALEDQRKTLIDQISSIIPSRELRRENGQVDLMTLEGVFLLSGTVKELTFTPTGIITPDRQFSGGAGVLSGVQVEGIDITPQGPGALAIQKGSLAAHFDVRDDVSPAFQRQIDSLSRNLIERFSNIDATLPPGAPGLFTDAGAAVDPSNELGLANRIAVNSAVDSDQGGFVWRLRDGLGAVAEGPAGAAGNILTLLDSFTASIPLSAGSGIGGKQTAVQAVAAVSSIIGSARVTAQTALAGSTARSDALTDAESAITGVDTDQELQKLLLIEQAFSANARVIQTAQELMQILMEL